MKKKKKKTQVIQTDSTISVCVIVQLSIYVDAIPYCAGVPLGRAYENIQYKVE